MQAEWLKAQERFNAYPEQEIIVMGVGGVGMAHVVAAARAGCRVVAIVDNNPSVLARARRQWENRWMELVESADRQPKTLYLTSLEGLDWTDPIDRADIAIIATPPHTHQSILYGTKIRQMARHVICEKPTSFPDNPLWKLGGDGVSISSEWVWHDRNLSSGRTIYTSFRMAYPESKTTSWGYTLPKPLDFGQHCLALLASNGHSYEGMDAASDDCVNLRTDKGEVEMLFSRDAPYGFWVNGEKWDWQEDLFERQLIYGRGFLGWNEVVSFEKDIMEFLDESAVDWSVR